MAGGRPSHSLPNVYLDLTLEQSGTYVILSIWTKAPTWMEDNIFYI